jgi:hypothetical protein
MMRRHGEQNRRGGSFTQARRGLGRGRDR